MVEGVIEETLPKGQYRVRLDSGNALRVSVAAQARRVTIKLIPGDRVQVAQSPYDPTRGRIISKLS